MNWKHITIAVLTLSLVAGLAMAQPQAGRPGMGPGHGGWMSNQPGPPPEAGFHKGCMGLNLTDEQQKEIQALRLAHQRKMVELKSETGNLRDKLKLVITDDKFNEKAVSDITGKLAKAQQQRMEMKAKHLRKVRDLLTDEQKVKFDQKVLAGDICFGHGDGFGMKGARHPGFHHERPRRGPGLR